MLTREEKKTLLKAIEEIKNKTVTVFEKFECKNVKESTNFMDIFLSMANLVAAIKKVEELVERY